MAMPPGVLQSILKNKGAKKPAGKKVAGMQAPMGMPGANPFPGAKAAKVMNTPKPY